jgi:cell volume regulation protein A
MFLVDRIILLAGVLLLVGVLSSKVSARIGLPVLILFLAVGMLAGEEGVGRIEFDNFRTAHAIGTVALALILFDGGLQTRVSALRRAWKPAALLATVGVVVTAAITGAAATLILGVPLPVGLLLGSIVASTDAAAVFSVLRNQGVHLQQRLAATLEIESGSNDPMAIFLTIALVELIAGRMTAGLGVAGLFLAQMGIGTLVGLACGWLAARLINGINLGAPGLYPLLAGACGLVAFGVAAVLGGSGFLAIYLAGIVLGNSRLVFQRGTFRFMDGLAWMGQIAMFVVLGLLSTPSDLLATAGPALLVSAVLILVARPVAVVLLLWPFGFSLREQVLISWVGLKGAVPIILATFPMMFGVPDGRLVFNIVFFVVLVSATLQGWTLPTLAARLQLQDERPERPPVSLELLALRDVKADIVDYAVDPGSPLAGCAVRDLRLPEGAVIAMISRGGTMVVPHGSTTVQPGDHLFVIARDDIRPAVDRVLRDESDSGPPGGPRNAASHLS